MTGDMPSGGAGAKAFFRSVSDFIWPPRSLVSGARGAGRGPLTPEEFAKLRLCPSHSATGAGCRWMTAREMKPGAWPVLRAHRNWTGRGRRWSMMIFSRRPVLDLKRSGRRYGLSTFAGWMGQAGGALIDTADVIMPVPLQTRRTPGQVGVARKARRRNVTGAFRVRKGREGGLPEQACCWWMMY